MRRTLSAVLAADVVGYSAQMSADAEGTLSTLRRLRVEIFGPAVAARHGRVVKSMGDGWIVVFSAVADAVECAMQVQDRLKIDGAVQLRMGLHLGDVTEADDDVFGDGVNIAARLQDLADPGALTISGAARALLDGTLRPSFDEAGKRALKNIAEPVPVWVRGGDVAGGGAALKQGGFPTLAIRPVETTDARAEVRELAAALTGEFATYLNSTRHLDARVAEEGASGGYELSCRLRASGYRLRLECQLHDGDGAIIAQQKHDGDLSDIFDWQDAVSSKASSDILSALIRNEAIVQQRTPPDQRTASQWISIGIPTEDMSLSTIKKSLECFIRAIEADPGYGYAYAQGLGLVGAISAVWGPQHFEEYAIPLKEWVEAVDRLEPPHSPSRVLLLLFETLRKGPDTTDDGAIAALMRDTPFDPVTRTYAGWINIYRSRSKQALECFRGLEHISEGGIQWAGVTSGIGRALLQLQRFDQALPYLQRVMESCPDYFAAHRGYASALAHLGRVEEAKVTLAKIVDGPDLRQLIAQNSYHEAPEVKVYLDGLRTAMGVSDT